jgi:hypothetical protein
VLGTWERQIDVFVILCALLRREGLIVVYAIVRYRNHCKPQSLLLLLDGLDVASVVASRVDFMD